MARKNEMQEKGKINNIQIVESEFDVPDVEGCINEACELVAYMLYQKYVKKGVDISISVCDDVSVRDDCSIGA